MEPITIFVSAVGLVAACHIAFSAANLFGKGIYSEGRALAKRGDWYCFFNTENLLGTKQQQGASVAERRRIERSRRQQRPRA